MIDLKEFNGLIENRRSIFPQDYTGEKVDDATINKMLENANWAPNHKLTEPWKFVVFTGEGLKKLGEAQAAVYKKVTEADGTFKDERYKNLMKKPMESSHVIAICMKRDENKSLPEVEEIGAVFCAVQNMYLTATAYGVACYLSTGGITYFEEAKKIFDLTPDDKLLGFLHIGIPKQKIYSGKRKPFQDKVVWIKG
jgi:nitroreductase